jgi:Protein of unknown function (DUF4446)
VGVASSLTGTQGIVALAGAGVAVVALLSCAALALSLHRLRRAQRLLFGDHGARDLVAHAVATQNAFEVLRDYVEEVGKRLDGRLGSLEGVVRGTMTHRALVRYDAYNELSGRQSVSIALLDDERSGIVLSCLHHRDQARVYAKQVLHGRGELELSPEEAEAVRLALSPARAPEDVVEHPA